MHLISEFDIVSFRLAFTLSPDSTHSRILHVMGLTHFWLNPMLPPLFFFNLLFHFSYTLQLAKLDLIRERAPLVHGEWHYGTLVLSLTWTWTRTRTRTCFACMWVGVCVLLWTFLDGFPTCYISLYLMPTSPAFPYLFRTWGAANPPCSRIVWTITYRCWCCCCCCC
ncbi:hypothetical protein SERLADRAFT_467831 [Serpula lacrymans var. lacrymans S7.9]|uniref:Uncharacterized protein n=1 Tax=Serpula lacrymans var. lacrymans (strain S7.9) TaxID=578457 RepID=F8NWY9_SERL9|nr:uncharacterized protein SERLADRAFT_467831 [Serpula lacrymans var. lacrymans S7.9]EGO24464.1 hypothetical protein SERLADRAFT_467831 [Serpula lacrymans var. lacrymans S7.9]